MTQLNEGLSSEQKQSIDDMSYGDMLFHWRFDPAGTSLFSGKLGDYFTKSMAEKKAKLSSEAQVAVSKAVGWEKL